METLFGEKQRFTQWWLWALLIGVNALMVYALIQQLVFGIPVGDNPAPNGVLIFVAFIIFGVNWLIYSFCLLTSVNKDEITFQLKPLQSKVNTIKWTEIEKAYVRTYKPLQEYGGWGYRIGLKGTAYNIRGNQGLQLELKNGKHILIGTQKAAELTKVIETVF